MQARTDRRAPDAHRIPLDMLVRLTHEDYEEPFDADGVDVSAGGIALRADYLPEVGDRLRCRLDGPADGAEIELDGEVVWAHDAGERSGEFGLRFATMDGEAEAALRRTLAHLGRPVQGARARLHLDSVATPIDAEVVDHDERALTVEQELPFLRIGMGVVVEGHGPAHGRLASVDLRVEAGVPRLLLVVEDARAAASDATLRDFEMPHEDTPCEPLTAHALDSIDRVAGERAFDDGAGADDSATGAIEAAEAAHPRGALEGARGAEEQAVRDDTSALPGALVARLEPAWQNVRRHASALARRARPALAALWAKLAVWVASAVSKGGPRAKRVWSKTLAVVQALSAKAAARVLRGKAKRRTTSAPVRVAEAPRPRRQREERPAAAPRKTARIVLVSALAFTGVGAAVYALSGDDAPPPVAPVVTPPAPEPAPAASAAQSATLPIEPAPAPEAAAPEAPAPAEPEGGRLDEPTYPTLAEPAAAPAESTRFGAAEVPNGRSRTIRMSQPVTTLRGERQPDGFTVTIPGSLALEGARGIAAANPAVDQSMILNRGDHSVLTVRFVAGQSPSYRVVARGAAIEITIGR